MMISAAPTVPQPNPYEPEESGESEDLGWGDGSSVCQLQLRGLVRQGAAAAGWMAYAMGSQWQRCQVVAPGVAEGTVPDAATVTSETFLQRLTRQATEVQPEVWAFCHRPPRPGPGWIYGVKFRILHSTDWAYVLLWFPDAPDFGVPGLATPEAEALAPTFPNLLTEVAALQTALRLDREHQHQRQQVDHYQDILRCLEHQLRHPLAMVHLYAANLQNSLTQEGDRQQAQTIREAVGHLSDQLTDLIAGCQRSQVQAERCSVPDLWAEAWQGLRLVAQGKGVSLDLGDRPLTIWGDRAQLVQAFTNLLHNALCFSPPQGQILAQWQAFQREVVITLADQGPGLSPTDLQQMFRPYYSHRPQGSGLGLTIARHIVQQHGGKLWAENLPQGGAQFSLALPLACP